MSPLPEHFPYQDFTRLMHNQDSTYPKGRFSRSARFYEGGIVWPLDSLSNRDEVSDNKLLCVR